MLWFVIESGHTKLDYHPSRGYVESVDLGFSQALYCYTTLSCVIASRHWLFSVHTVGDAALMPRVWTATGLFVCRNGTDNTVRLKVATSGKPWTHILTVFSFTDLRNEEICESFFHETGLYLPRPIILGWPVCMSVCKLNLALSVQVTVIIFRRHLPLVKHFQMMSVFTTMWLWP